MRTKHILTALALPALFAACTADEFETVNQNAGLQEERAKVAENFTLLTNGIQTRYAVEGGAGISFNFEKGDQIGAAIIDQYDPTAEKPEDFTVIYSLAGNNPFEFQGNDEWKSNTQLGIGHYLFVYPYNVSDNNRAAVAYELPVIQELGEGAEGLNAAIEKGNKAVAAAVLHEGEESVDISLKNLFTYPKLTINFDNGEDVTTVSQIVLKADNVKSTFTVKGGFDHKVVSALFNLDEEKGDATFDGRDFYKQDKTTKKYSIDWNLVNTEDFLLQEGSAGAGYNPFKEGRTSDYIIVKFPEGTKVKPAANTDNKYVEARIMMPSIEEFKDNDDEHNYTLYVYTDNGVYSTAFEPSSFSFSDRTDKDKIAAALARSASNGLTLRALNTTDNKKGDAGTIVTTLADWNDLVDRFGDTKQNQKIIIVGDDFAFDGAEDIEWPETCTFTITTDVKVKGNVEMKNVNVDGTINVEKGATLTVNNTLSAEKKVTFGEDLNAETVEVNTVIKNEGTVVIAAEYDKAAFEDNNKVKDYYVGVNAIENKGTLIVNKEAKAEFALTNVQKAVVTNNGEVKLGNYMDLADGKNKAGNNGTINNNGTLRTGDFTNVAPEIENEGKENEVIKNMPVINNAKGARMVAEGEFVNNATLVNEGTLACLNTTTGSITNERTLDSKKGAVTYITDNNGKVIVYEAKPLTVTINGVKDGQDSGAGIIEYETSAKSEDFKESLVNSVIASSDLTIADGTISMLTFKGDATLTLAKPAGTSTKEGVINGLTIEEGNVVLASDVTVSTLIIKEEGSLNVPSNITMTYSGEDATHFNNEGLILVGGTFSATNVDVTEGGDVQNNGGKIEWAPSADKQNETAYNNALKAMVEKWMLTSTIDTWEKVNNIKKTTGWTSAGWSELADAARVAYNTWKKAGIEDVATFETNILLADETTHTMIDKIISDYKTASYTNVLKTFNAKYPDNSWLKTNTSASDGEYSTFLKKTSTAEMSEIVNESKSVTKMVDAFATVAKNITLSEVKASAGTDATEVENKAVYLTLQSGINGTVVDENPSMIPAYSYIGIYKGAEEYDVMSDLKSLKTTLADVDDLKDVLKNSYANLVEVQKAVSKLYELSQSDDLFVSTKIKATCIDEKATNVMNWKFTDKQISTLNTKVTE